MLAERQKGNTLVRIAGRMASARVVAMDSGGIDALAGRVADGAKAGSMPCLRRIENCFAT